MLILNRNSHQSIMIGDDITVTLITCRNGQARIGIEAPRSVGVHREEIYHRIKAEKAVEENKDVGSS